jgi:hypothetical protein
MVEKMPTSQTSKLRHLSKRGLRVRVILVLKKQGFRINPHVRPPSSNKATLRQIQKRARLEQIAYHKKFLEEYFDLSKFHCRDGKDIAPENIQLELREVKPGSLEEVLFRWWNFIWWSIPYQHPYGRQMRFLLWDTTHDAPFGLIGLQSPVLKMAVRDNSLGISRDELDIWINRALYAQRVGALPPYNELLGGKMVALALTANELREAYRKKYKNYTSIIKGRRLDSSLLFITTTSAFGKSSLYNRLNYRDEIVAERLGYTQGSGSFHIPEDLYVDILKFLADNGINVARRFGHGPSRRLRLITLGLKHLGLPSYEYHGVKREFYIFPLAKNLREVVQQHKKPIWINRPFNGVMDYWKERWAIPRAERMQTWKNFRKTNFFKKVERILEEL